MNTKVLIRAPEGSERRAAARLTGRYLMSFTPEAHDTVTAKLEAAGLPNAKTKAMGAETAKPLPHGSHYTLPLLGVAVVDPHAAQEDALHSMAAQEDAVHALVPERVVRAINPGASLEYVRGWRDATDALSSRLLAGPADDASLRIQAFADSGTATWGLTATGVLNSRYSGQGIKLAVLDTGLDLSHPDFSNRHITTQNLVGDGQPFHDGVGHGTHCMGTAAGPLHPSRGSRYGIAYDAILYAGRVLDDNGEGGDGTVLQGIEWAISQECTVISLSLGAPWLPGNPPFNPVYERAAQTALAHDCLLVVAAGNEADDVRYVGAVGSPGNCPSVLTVAAVDSSLRTASFSDRIEPDAPGVKGPDCAAPGVAVCSSWPVSAGSYNTIDGTSMATPHVAGIAALFAQSDSALRGSKLKSAILAHCELLSQQAARKGEIGAGLVRAP